MRVYDFFTTSRSLSRAHDKAADNAENAVAADVVFWHYTLGHTSVIQPKLYADGYKKLPIGIK